MNRPSSFLLGILAALLPNLLGDDLPTVPSLSAALPWLLLILVPAALARATDLAVSKTLMGASGSPLRLGTRLQLQQLSVPLCFGILVVCADLPALSYELAPESQTLQLSILLGPLILMEALLRRTEGVTERRLALASIQAPLAIGPSRMVMVRLLLTVLFTFTATLDLLFLSREVEVFLAATDLGFATSLILLGISTVVAMPLIFRFVLPTKTIKGAPKNQTALDTARELGFSGAQVLELETGMRTINAAMVGVLPWPRYLILSDGLLSFLDPNSLRGVVAHEAGHARGQHVIWIGLFLLTIVMLILHPAVSDWFESLHLAQAGLIGGLTLGATFFGLRALFRRFELEADQSAAEALGAPGPCIDALQRVQQLHTGTDRAGVFDFHPSFSRRILNLLAWENDESFRSKFRRKGKLLRRGLLMSTTLVGALSLWPLLANWPFELAVVRHYSGDFAGANDALAKLQDDDRPEVEELRQEVQAALGLVGNGGPWYDIRERLSRDAWQQALATVSERGIVAARPWLGLSISGSKPDPLRVCVYRLAIALAEERHSEADALRQHLQSYQLPPALAKVIAEH